MLPESDYFRSSLVRMSAQEGVFGTSFLIRPDAAIFGPQNPGKTQSPGHIEPPCVVGVQRSNSSERFGIAAAWICSASMDAREPQMLNDSERTVDL